MFNFVNNLNYLIFYNDLLQSITIIVDERHRRELKRRLQTFFFHKIKLSKTCFLFVIFKFRDIRDSILNFSSIKNKILTNNRDIVLKKRKRCVTINNFYVTKNVID